MQHIKDILSQKTFVFVLTDLVITLSLLPSPAVASAATLKNVSIDGFTAKSPIHVLGSAATTPKGLSPDQIKTAYRLPKSGGSGTVALIEAYDDKELESDLAAFDAKFNLPACTVSNGCLEKHLMTAGTKEVSGWSLETALDSEWAHAIAPKAKILVVEAASDSGPALLKAVDYARSRPDVVSVSMSWGGTEFKDETKSDSHFTVATSSDTGIAFFAASGDDGTGASWPAASPKVIAVGGTTLAFDKDGTFGSEKAWAGSGGGISAYESEPGFQVSYSIARAKGMRAIPDVSFDADPKSGYSVYHQPVSAKSQKGWFVVGGTSAGTPQWAAIKSLGGPSAGSSTASFLTKLYQDKASANHALFFRDITSGSNGDCGYYCTARAHYDYVTGLGSPIAYKF